MKYAVSKSNPIRRRGRWCRRTSVALEGALILMTMIAGVIATPWVVLRSKTKAGTALAFFLLFWLPLILAYYHAPLLNP